METDLQYDTRVVWEVFKHNKNSTLEYGWLRGRVLKQNGRMTNDRQNKALDYLVTKGLIEKVAHGRWRYVQPIGRQPDGTVERPSAEVVASAPVSVEQAQEVMPRFRGATTDLVYSALRESAKKGKDWMTVRELQHLLGVESDRNQANNVAAAVNSLEKMGWIETDRKSHSGFKNDPYQSRALAVNSKGRSADEIRHRRAGTPVQASRSIPAADLPAPAASGQQAAGQAVFTRADLLRYGELAAQKHELQRIRDAAVKRYDAEIAVIEAELAKYGQ